MSDTDDVFNAIVAGLDDIEQPQSQLFARNTAGALTFDGLEPVMLAALTIAGADTPPLSLGAGADSEVFAGRLSLERSETEQMVRDSLKAGCMDEDHARAWLRVLARARVVLWDEVGDVMRTLEGSPHLVLELLQSEGGAEQLGKVSFLSVMTTVLADLTDLLYS